MKTCELFAAVRNGKPAVMFIVVELVYRTVCATWAPKMITVEIEIKKKKRNAEYPSVQKLYSTVRKSEMPVCQK